jgi:rhamnosyl/mannosyltransferase
MPHVLHAFKVFKPEVEGGIPVAIGTICAGLSEPWEHRILVARSRGAAKTDDVDGVPTIRTLSFGTVWSLPMAPTYPMVLAHEAKKADLVALHAPFPLGDLGVAVMGRKRPLVVHWHADIVRQRRLKPLIAPLVRRTLQRANAIIISHPGVAASSEYLAAFKHKLHIVPYGLDPTPWLSCDREDLHEIAQLKERYPRLIVAVGRLVTYKGFDVLIEAAGQSDVQVVICGTGAEEANLRAQIAAAGLEGRVRIEGFTPERRLKQYLHAAQALALPSVSTAEAFGLVQVEAMFCGCAIINTNLPTGVPWVARNGLEALTIPPGDPVALAQAMRQICDTPGLAQALGRAGRQRALSEFTANLFGTRVEAVYTQVLQR